MYFLRSKSDKDADQCEIDIGDILNQEVIKGMFTNIIKTAMEDVYDKMTKLQEEVTMLKESNIELIHLLTSSGQSNCNVNNGNKFNVSMDAVSNHDMLPKHNDTRGIMSKNDGTVQSKVSHGKMQIPGVEKTKENKNTHNPPFSTDKVINTRSSNGNIINKQQQTQKKSTRIVFGSGCKKTNLTAVTRKSWIYVGRIIPGTGVTGIKKHLENIFPDQTFEINLLPPWKNGRTEAFKIQINHCMESEIFKSENWPDGTLVKKINFFRDSA
nr:unnamed protein product [Callosobruchus analis]